MPSETRRARASTALLAVITAVAALVPPGCVPWVSTSDMCEEMPNLPRYYLDADGDGYGDDRQYLGCDPLTDAYVLLDKGRDCNDQDPAIHPAAREVCDGIDNDCDALIDDEDLEDAPIEGSVDWYYDLDVDGFGSPDLYAQACDQPELTEGAGPGPFSTNSDDCDDLDPLEYPGAIFYYDEDGDGFGDSDRDTAGCEKPDGHAYVGGDCNDEDARIHPDTLWYYDGDGDGYGVCDDEHAPVPSCTPPSAEYTGITLGQDCPTESWDLDDDLGWVGENCDVPGCEGDTDDANPYFTTTSPWVLIEGGGQHSCGVRADGSVSCWGTNVDEQLDVPAEVAGPLVLSSSHTFSCALVPIGDTGQGAITCWGVAESVNPDTGEVEEVTLDAPPYTDFVHATAGRSSACGVRASGDTLCWGDDFGAETSLGLGAAVQAAIGPPRSGQDTVCVLLDTGGLACSNALRPPSGSLYSSIESDTDLWCALEGAGKESGRMVCWDGSGQQAAPDGDRFVDMAVGAGWSCGLDLSGELDCADATGQAPEPHIDPGTRPVQLAGGARHACALLDTGEINCWGDNRSGQATAPIAGPYELAAGAHVSCGRSFDAVHCWGDQAALQEPAGTWVRLEAGRAVACALSQAGAMGCFANHADTSVPDGGFVDLGLFGQESGNPHSADPPDTVCGLRADGSLSCWGAYGITDTLPDDVALDSVSAGLGFACGITSRGGIACVGDRPDGQPTGYGWVEVAAGLDHACALSETGSVTCWGADDFGEAASPTGDDYVGVATHTHHSCAVRVDGNVHCWGTDLDGSLDAPDDALGADNFVSVSLGVRHGCGLRETGEIACWGADNDEGRVSGTPGGDGFVAVSAASEMSCGLSGDGEITCWGDYTPKDMAPPKLGSKPTDGRLAAGDDFACVITETGTVVCAGRDDLAQSTPPVATSTPYHHLGLGQLHGCAVDDQGMVDCWGSDAQGQASPPIDLDADPVVRLAASGSTTCALLDTGQLHCWGVDLGMPDELRDMVLVDVAVGAAHACALEYGGAPICWGDDSLGQLDLPEPADGSALPPFDRIWAGDHHSCAIDIEHHVWCWGDDSEGQVRRVPAYLFRDLALGRAHSCGLQLDRTVVCWGRDLEGQATPPDVDLWTE